MDVGNRDALILPVPPEPFALIVGSALRGAPPEQFERAMRRMGLRPERIEYADLDLDDHFGAPRFRLSLGEMSLIAGPARDGALDSMDPLDPATSLLAATLPADWREAGQCWLFQPETVAPDGDRADALPQDPFLMMLLLIDLFDASHIFWSPARLWSDAMQFRSAIAEMRTSGMPPVLHLVAFRRREVGGGAAIVRTRGLALFAGQELAGTIPPGWTVAEVVKRLARLALDLMIHGPIRQDQRVPGREPGEMMTLRLEPVWDGDAPATVAVTFGRDD